MTSIKHTWTKHIYRCEGCGQYRRASQESIDETRKDCGYTREEMSDADIAKFDFCLNCCDGKKPEHAGEMLVCFGPGNIPAEPHADETVREVEYRGDPSLPWEKRALCSGCIADARHAGMTIRGEQPEEEAEQCRNCLADIAGTSGAIRGYCSTACEEAHSDATGVR